MVLSKIDRNKIDEAFETYDNAKGKSLYRKIFRDLLKIPKGSNKQIITKARELLRNIEESIGALDNLERIYDILMICGISNIDVDVGFARGLEYYTGMIFEVYAEKLDVAVAGGGRYDKLLSLFKWDIPAVGCAIGLDRISLAMEGRNVTEDLKKAEPVLIAPLEESLTGHAFEIAHRLRKAEIGAVSEMVARGPRDVLNRAKRVGIRFVGFVGSKESDNNTIQFRDLLKGTEFVVNVDSLAELKHMIVS
jgi:histidyl-tRNA synthetase